MLGIFTKGKALAYVKNLWAKEEKRKRDFKKISKYNKLLTQSEENLVDNQTWNDLDMDQVFSKIDRTLTTPGENVLYDMLRKPLYNKEKLRERGEIIKLFQKDSELREKIQIQLLKVYKQKNGDVLALLWDDLKENKLLKVLFLILGNMPLVFLVLSIFYGLKMTIIPIIVILYPINLFIHYKINSTIRSQVEAISYFSSILRAAKYISNLKVDEISNQINKLNDILNKVKEVSKNSASIGRIEGIDVLGDYFTILFLIEERAYYKLTTVINKNRDELKELYKIIGEIDAYISIASYRESAKYYTEPEFVEEKAYLNIKEGIHPLIKNPVANSLTLNKNGIILTGTNMSGKSTFLRMIGLNMLLSQTIYTSLAKEYKGSFLNIITSISPEDSVEKGKSYYLGEAEAMLRIIKAVDSDITVFCMIDEIFRGTNPIERVSAASEILKYLIKGNCLPVVATHDHELTKIVKDRYRCYYFSEMVDEDEGLKFDYEIKQGVSPTTNAIKLLRYLGYPKEITEKAYEQVKRDINYIEDN